MTDKRESGKAPAAVSITGPRLIGISSLRSGCTQCGLETIFLPLGRWKGMLVWGKSLEGKLGGL